MGIMTVTGMSSIVAGLNASMAQSDRDARLLDHLHPARAPGEHIDDDEWRRRKALTLDEVEAIAERPAVEAIAPLQCDPAESVKYGTERARDVQVLGTTEAYEEVHDSYVEKGRFLSPHRRQPRRAGGGDRDRHRGRPVPLRRPARQGDLDRRPALHRDRRAAEEGQVPVPQHGQPAPRAGELDPEAGPPLQLHDGGHASRSRAGQMDDGDRPGARGDAPASAS